VLKRLITTFETFHFRFLHLAW